MRVAVGSHKAAWLADPLPYCAAALLFASILFGGGGAEGPLQNGILEGLGAILLCAVAASHFNGRPLAPGSTGPIWLAVAILCAILIQLVPLPPAIWASLPGRETAASVDMLIHGKLAWRPVSLDPEATRRSAAALLLPLPIMLIAAGASRRGLLFMIRTAVAGALVSAALGAAQIALGSPDALAPYGAPVPGIASGLFANSNHHAAFMLSALIAASALIRLDEPKVKIRTRKGVWRFHLAWLLLPIFAIITIATMSRAGWALLVPVLAASLLIATGRKGIAGAVIVALVAIAVGGTAVLTFGSSAADVGQVQSLLQDNRLISLPDILYTFQQFWPVGSGLGTFVPVYQANENLDLVSTAYLNHAHNDILELMIEMGVLGALLLLAGAIGLAVRLAKVFRRGSSLETTAAITGAAIVAVLVLHSLADYPLRADAVAAMAGLAIGLLVSKVEEDPEDPKGGKSRKRASRGFGSTSQSVGRSAS